MSDSQNSNTNPRPPQILDWFAVAAFGSLILSSQVCERGSSRLLRCVGVVCLVLAPAFFIPPFILLKKHGQTDRGRPFFDTNIPVDRGLYAVVRHPQYLGYILVTVGFVLLSQHVATALLGAIAIVFFYLHTLKEEGFCMHHLGRGYEDYCRRVPRFNVVKGIMRHLVRTRRAE
jgi:protein-S-isoprenylcysteine O-methyltransferase Ste14